ncbi:MAG: hypothetical protein A2798_03445 [Candidatus Levybacteria bacterium RIFCSPHIGHO2_01_FULL_37_17]|nr:MAG: hypothetical protein A2798_03445 [Candidatus Levybacteria bacterium RIFCSPHIGHO2_01_FULL_37_17]OGH36908.1 MAG: hypothetical protein A2959_01435 [Candidatus Levybacteria bacterium RIFCSPLOWO2_01_FULL_38_23]
MERESSQRMNHPEWLFTHAPARIRGIVVRKGIKNILRTTGIEAPIPLNAFWRDIVNLYQQDCAINIVTNHTSHADAYVAAKVGADIALVINQYVSDKDRINGFVMPFAKSIQTQTQGQLLNAMFNDSLPVFEKLGITPVYTATENDIAQGRVSEANRVNYTRQMIQGVKEGKGIIILPEGRVEGGRRDSNGKIKGMQEFRAYALSQSLRIATSEKHKVAVIPAGISGGYNVYDPQTKSFTKDTWAVGIGWSTKNLFHVRVGMPIVFERKEIRNMDPKELDRIIGGRIAALLPTAEKGTVYT